MFLFRRSPARPLAVMLILCQALASAQFGPQQRIEFSYASSVYLNDEGDIDGDGDVDLVVQTTFDMLRWMPNAGDGRYLPQRDIHAGTLLAGHLTDLDGDGDLDYVATTFSGAISWFENLGGGDFGPITTIQTLTGARQLTVADVDLDGDPDLVAWSENPGPLAVLWNQGQAVFSPAQLVAASLSNVRSVRVADLDGDGLQDLVVGAIGITWYPSQGTIFGAVQTLPTTTGTYRLECADIDADGDVDIISMGSSDRVRKHTNQGGGVFSAQEDLLVLVTPRSHELTDLDQDGVLDILYGSNFRIGWMRGQGNGQFDPAIELSVVGCQSRVSAQDLTGDGLPDVVAGMSELLTLFPATGGGGFGAVRTLARNAREYEHLACGDLDGDGDQDVLATVSNEDRLVWFRNDGTAHFALEDTLTNMAYQASLLQLADLNGDGDLDVVFRQDGFDDIAWCTNLGAGVFTDPITITPSTIADGRRFGVGDVDGDGDVDLVAPNAQNQVLTFLNDGTGTFTPGNLLHVGSANLIKCLDFDADGDQDVIMVASNDVWLLINDGTGAFLLVLQETAPASEVFLDAVDLDKDGLPDILAVGESQARWYRNNGDGTFTMSIGVPGTTSSLMYAVLGDVDLDGLPDFVRAYGSVNTFPRLVTGHQLLEPGFTNTPVIAQGSATLGRDVAIDLADLDNDGDLDIVACSGNIGMLACHLNQAIGPYRMEGLAFHDANTNGVRDAGEPALPLMPMAITPQLPQFFAASNGQFSVSVPPGSYSVQALPPATYWTPTTPDSLTVMLSDAMPVAQGLEFGFSLPDTTVLDPSVVLLAAGCADTATIHASVRNLGAPVQNGELVLELDPVLTYVNATPPPTTQAGGTLTWNFQDLEPLHQEAVQVRVVMPSSSTLPYELSMPITASSALVQTQFQDTLQRPLTCSAGANDKLVDPVGYGSIGAIDPATPELEYTIRFRNTGNAPVQALTLVDQLDEELDPASLQPVAWSHGVSSLNVDENRRLVVRFDGILLPDSTSDPVGSEGFLRFRAAPLTVPPPSYTNAFNTAGIGFGAQAPILTNTTETTWYPCGGSIPFIQVVNDTTLFVSLVDSVHWYLNGSPIPGADSDTLHISLPGTYTALVVDMGGCQVLSDPYYYLTTGVEEQAPWARVRPVPASDMLYVERSDGHGGCIGLSDALGRVVVPCTPVTGTRHQLNVQGLETGRYLLTGRLPNGELLRPMPVLVVH